jgi:hypothetical protein
VTVEPEKARKGVTWPDAAVCLGLFALVAFVVYRLP